MEEWGREMVQNCGGLPLAIVVLGGILVTKPTMIEWEKVYYDSRSTLKSGKRLGEAHQREVFDILVWSYNVLPPQLKMCFLYLGKFEEDKEIEAERLYQLLIAEGMVLSSDKSGEESMMEVAESYMGELVHKSMVQAKFEDEVYPQRKFKSFVLHDLMRDLSLSIAKREDFFTVVDFQKVTKNTSVELTSSSTRQLVVYFDEEGNKSIKGNPFFFNKARQRRVTSILLIRSFEHILGLHLANFKFLRVFSLEGFEFNGISVSYRLFVKTLPKDLPKLIRLEKLTVQVEAKGYVVEEIIKYLASYSRPLYLTITIRMREHGSENGADMWRRLFGNRNLRLGELFIDSKLPELSQIFGRQEQQLGNTYIDVSLIRITKLDLWWSKLEEDPMPLLEKIPTLHELRLYMETYMGKEMVCSATGFPKLTHLGFGKLPNLAKWRVEEGCMPILNSLYISDCPMLEDLPEGLRFFNSLEKLYLWSMPSDLYDRVRVVNGEPGPGFYKVAHIPRVQIDNIDDLLPTGSSYVL